MIHLLRKYDVAPLRSATMMRCLPQCAVRHTSFASAFIIRQSRHHLPKANIIQKTHLCLGRQKCVFCWRRRRDLPFLKHSRNARKSQICFISPCFSYLLEKTVINCFFCGDPRLSARANLSFRAKKTKTTTEWWLLLFGAEGEI